MRHRVEEENKRHMRDVQRNLFNTLFGFNVNPRLGDEIFQTLQDASRLYREDCSLRFVFNTLTDSEREQCGHGRKNLDELIAVNVTVSYRVRNTSQRSQRWKADPYFVNSLQLDKPADRFLFFDVQDCEEADNCVKAGAMGEEALRPEFTSVEGRRQLDLGYVTIGPNKPTQVHYTYRTVKRSTDCHSWLSVLPMDALRIYAVSVAPQLELDFDVETAHRKDAHPVGDHRGASSKLRELAHRGPLPTQPRNHPALAPVEARGKKNG